VIPKNNEKGINNMKERKNDTERTKAESKGIQINAGN